MEDKKALNEEELEKVSGGVISRTVTVYDFEEYELFFDGLRYYYLLSAKGKLEEYDKIEVRRWEAGRFRDGSYQYVTVKQLLSCQSLGVVSYDNATKL